MTRRLLALGLAAVILAMLACGGGGEPSSTPHSSPTGTRTPPTVTATAKSTPISTPILTPTPSPTSQRLLYREFGRIVDVVWAVDPADTAARHQMAAISHAADWGSFVSLSPDGNSIAYTRLPEGGREPTSEAEAWAADIANAKRMLLASGVDLKARPQWSPDGKLIYLRRNNAGSIELLQVNRTSGEETSVVKRSTDDVSDIIMVGFADDNVTLYYVETNNTQTATTLSSLNTSTGKSAAVMPLSDQLVRDFALSPDGRRLAFFSPFQLRTYLADIQSGSVAELPATSLPSAVQMHPVWHPDGGSISIGQLPQQGRPGAVANVPLPTGEPTVLASPEKGFDLPLTWSPDGRSLVVRSFPGDSLANPGQASLILVSAVGQRTTLVGESDADPFGWVTE